MLIPIQSQSINTYWQANRDLIDYFELLIKVVVHISTHIYIPYIGGKGIMRSPAYAKHHNPRAPTNVKHKVCLLTHNRTSQT